MQLSERAMLATLNVHSWQATRTDRKGLSKEVADRAGVNERRAGKYRKFAIDIQAPSFRAVGAAVSELRATHYKFTLPWGDQGARILTTANFDAYSKAMRDQKAKFAEAVVTFVADYPRLQANAQVELNGLYNAGDYPSNIGAKFGVDVHMAPLPESDDFRVKLAADQVAEIKGNIDATRNEFVAQAMADPYKRLYDHITRMTERLGNPEHIFRDTLVSGLAELVQILPGLNLTGDEKLEELRRKAEAMIAGVDAEMLRQVPAVRRSVANKAQEIQDAMSAFMGVPAAQEAA